MIMSLRLHGENMSYHHEIVFCAGKRESCSLPFLMAVQLPVSALLAFTGMVLS